MSILSRHRRGFLVLLLIAVAVVVGTIIACFCSYPHYTTDPPAKTAGYKLYTGRTQGLRISFEYPDTWRRQTIEKHDTFRVVFFDYETGSGSIGSDATAGEGGEFEGPNELIHYELDRDSSRPEFDIMSLTKTRLGQAEGEEAIYSYRLMLKSPTVIDKIVVQRTLAAEYQGRIYDISILANADSYDIVKEDFEHLIATFRFLD